MFEFVKDFDLEIYNEIINEVEFNIWNDRCISIIQSEIEKIIKNLFKESNIVITNTDKEGVVYREYNPTLSRLLDEEESFRGFLFKNNILKENDIDSYWIIHKNANIKKHGARTGEIFIIDNEMKESALKFLFKLCFNVYIYKFNKTPSAYWDEKYFEKLLTKPEEKTIEVEKIIEKEIKVVDDVELNKLKKEHEELKHKFDTMQKSTIPTATNFELINKLEIANKCLQNGDFENAKIAFNNCRTLDISCIDAYIGLIMCNYKQNNMEDLADNIKNDNSLEKNENYINMNSFCDKKLVEKFNKEIEETIHYVKFEKPYQNAIIEFNNNEYEKAYRDFQLIHDYKDASDKSKELLSILEQDALRYEKNKWYERAINEYNSLQFYTKGKELREYIESRINELKEKIKNEEETLVIDKNNCSLLEKENSPLSPRPSQVLIKHVIIKDDIKYIGPSAFKPFPNIKKITLPDSLEEIDIGAFRHNDFNKIEFNEKNGYKYLGSEKNPYMVLIYAENFDVKLLDKNTKIIFHCSNNNLRELIIPQSVVCVCQFALNTPNIEKLIINHSMKVFGGFSESANLRIIELNAPVNKISERAFACCDNLNEFIAPKTDFMKIEKSAFGRCKNLKLVNLGQVKQLDLDGYAFEDCDNLKELILPNDIRTTKVFFSLANLIKKPINWYVGSNFFSGSPGLKKIKVIGSGYNNDLPSYSFHFFENLEEVILDNFNTIGEQAFNGCKNLKNIQLPKSLKKIESEAFSGCYNLESIILPDSLESIGIGAFQRCSELQSIKLPNNINVLSTYIFSGCTNLSSVQLPDSITNIDSFAFSGCTNLSSVQLPDSITNIDGYAFYGCKNLTKINLPKSLKKVYFDAFEGCPEHIKEMFTLKKQ